MFTYKRLLRKQAEARRIDRRYNHNELTYTALYYNVDKDIFRIACGSAAIHIEYRPDAGWIKIPCLYANWPTRSQQVAALHSSTMTALEMAGLTLED